ncbi:MAG TPA: hypothetical protein VMS17_20660, partial [Gemmataceae bacterium]|nr:hypothetical protein [Gemmataceae bacterium]
SRRRRVRLWVAAAVLTAAAAALLIAITPPKPKPTTLPALPRGADAAPTLWGYERALRRSDGDASVVVDETMPAFEWPIAGPAPLSGRFPERLQ